MANKHKTKSLKLNKTTTPINKSQEFTKENGSLVDDPYQTNSKGGVGEITNIELDNIKFKDEETVVHKGRSKVYSKKMNYTHDGFMNKANTFSSGARKNSSINANKRMNKMMEDYMYAPINIIANKRNSINSKQIIGIYEQDDSLKSIMNTMHTSIRKNCK
mmetsp:Transcript_23184/g.20565  ORF Transcript_23184/g.20565 Transcript_23184/m.20565 type:complete len:161 (+) Transcript_23184:127-609(+)